MSGGSFNAGTLSDIDACIFNVQGNINRGTLTATSKPTSTQVQDWLIRAKQELMEAHGYTFKRVFAYMDTSSGEYRYTLPADFGEGGFVLRDITQAERLVPIDPVSFDSLFPDVADEANDAPTYYTIKDRELWFSAPVSGTYRLELEYDRTGDDASSTTISYIPELMRFKMCDYATYRAMIVIGNWNGATAYKSEWEMGQGKSKKRDTRKRWAALGYKVRGYVI